MYHSALRRLRANKASPCPPLALRNCTPTASASVLTTWAIPRLVTRGFFKHQPLMLFFDRTLKVRLRYSMGMLENRYKDLYIPKVLPWAHGVGFHPKALQHSPN